KGVGMDFISSCINANREIYDILKEADPTLKEPQGKGFGGDISKKIDLVAEEIFRYHLEAFGRFDSEESGESGEGDCRVIVDPLDGSDNFASDIPFYGTSVALEIDGRIRESFVCNLVTGTYYRKSGPNEMKGSVITRQVIPYEPNPHASVGIFEKSYARPDLVEKVHRCGLKFRTPGALALSLAMAREVTFVLFAGSMREYDIAAGWHINEELFCYRDEELLLVSSNREIFDKLYHELKG
ncbi:MAG: inositol monophosphatase, partial [Campylobacterales bacterium]